MSALDPQRISGWRKGIPLKCQHCRRAYMGFGVLSSPLPYLPLLTLPTASGKQKYHLWKGDRIFFGPTRTKLTMLPSHSAFSADQTAEQEIYVPPPSSSGSPRASWGYYFTPTTHLYKNEEKHLHTSSSSHYSQL